MTSKLGILLRRANGTQLWNTLLYTTVILRLNGRLPIRVGNLSTIILSTLFSTNADSSPSRCEVEIETQAQFVSRDFVIYD